MMQPVLPPQALASTQPTAPVKLEDDNVSQITSKTQIPEFWADEPRLWFGQFEVIVADQKKGEKAKFNQVIARLNKENVRQVSDLVMEPPVDKPYTVLKERLLSVYEESDTQRARKLLKEIDLGEQKPSQLLRNMKDLNRGKFPEDTLRMLWLGHLPATARTVLAVSDITDLNKLAEQADKIMETAELRDTITEVAANSSPSSTDLLIEEVSKLSKSIQEMHRSSQRERKPYKPRSRSPSPGRRWNNSSQRRDRRRSADWVCSTISGSGRKLASANNRVAGRKVRYSQENRRRETSHDAVNGGPLHRLVKPPALC